MGKLVPRDGFSKALKKFYDWCDLRAIFKTADQTVTASTVLVDDADLQFPMVASGKYSFRARLYIDTTAAGDFKWRHVGPASPTLVRIARRCIVPGATADADIAVDTAFSGADIPELTAGTNGGWLMVEGVIHNGVNAGTFKIQWAQNTSDAGNTVVRAGSWMEVTKVA